MVIDPSGNISPRITRREWAILLAILVLAAVVRLGWPNLTEFKADEGRLLTTALVMSDGQLALRGISSSVGFPNAPMSVWLYALPLVIWAHPYAATLFTGILSVAAVAGVYWLARRYWGYRAAVVATLMLSVSPWAIVFSRKIWAQNLLPVFAVCWAIAAVLAFVERRRVFLVVHIVCLAIAVQIHPAAVSLIPATLLFLLVFRRSVDFRYLLAGGLAAMLTTAPFLWYLWNRWRAEGGLAISSGQSSLHFSLDAIHLTLDIITGQGVSALAGPDYNGFWGEAVIRFLWLALILAGLGWAFWQVVRKPERPPAQVAFICLVWALAPLLVFFWQWTPVYIHYFIVALPAPFVLAGAFFDEIASRARPRFRFVAWMALVTVAVLQLATWVNVMAAVAANPLAGGFGIPLGVKLSAADDARILLNESGAAEVLLAGDGSDPEQEDFPAEFRALLHGVPVRYADLNREAVFPGAPAVLLLDTKAADELTSTRDLYLAPADEWKVSDVPGSELAYSVRLMPGATYPAASVDIIPQALLANFVQLIGYNGLDPLEGGALWDVHWRPAENPDPSNYHLFNHLLDRNDQRVAQADAASFAASQWLAGDVVISRFWLPVPDEVQTPLTMRIGMYRYPSLENVPVLDEAANPAADAVTVPLGE